jgi:hypothetical protein
MKFSTNVNVSEIRALRQLEYKKNPCNSKVVSFSYSRNFSYVQNINLQYTRTFRL